MDYIFTGFHDANAIRHFAFEFVADDRSRTPVMVHADMAMARKYRILPQDLPMLCRRLLVANTQEQEGAVAALVTLTEDNMIGIQTAARDAAERKPSRRPKRSPATGQAWREFHAGTPPTR